VPPRYDISLPGLPAPLDGGVPTADAIAWILASARRHFGMDVAFITEVHEGVGTFRFVDASKGGEGVCRVGAEDRLGARSLNVPIRFSDGTRYGTFSCWTREPDATLGARDSAVMRMLAELLVGHLEREELARREAAATIARVEQVLTRDGFAIVFQPILELGTMRVAGYEALSRFHDPPGIGPEQWFRDAHAVGLGVDLEIAAIRGALDFADRLGPELFLAVNVSPATLEASELADVLTRFAPDRLVVELTEHDEHLDYEQLRLAAAPFRNAGTRFALDDTGAGYAGLQRLVDFGPELIKLDIELVRGVAADPARQAMIAALAWFARATGAMAIAEGIEAEDDLDALRAFGISYGQGYLLGRPSPLPSHRRPTPTMNGSATGTPNAVVAIKGHSAR